MTTATVQIRIDAELDGRLSRLAGRGRRFKKQEVLNDALMAYLPKLEAIERHSGQLQSFDQSGLSRGAEQVVSEVAPPSAASPSIPTSTFPPPSGDALKKAAEVSSVTNGKPLPTVEGH